MKKTYLKVSERIETDEVGNYTPKGTTYRVSPLLLHAFELYDNEEVTAILDDSGAVNHCATLKQDPLRMWKELVEKGEYPFQGDGLVDASEPITFKPPTWDRHSPFSKAFLHLQVLHSGGTSYVYGDRPHPDPTEIYGLRVWIEEK